MVRFRLPTFVLQTVYLLIGPDYSLLWFVVVICMCSLSSGGLLGMFHSGVLSDFTIVCGASDFKVHKTVLFARSGYFQVPFHFSATLQLSVSLCLPSFLSYFCIPIPTSIL